MTSLKPQTTLGGFALLNLLLAGTAIGRVLGFGFDEALYVSTLFLILIAWAFNRYRNPRKATMMLWLGVSLSFVYVIVIQILQYTGNWGPLPQ